MSFEELNLKKFFPNDLINIKNKVLRTWDNIDKYKSDLDLKKIIFNVLENQNISYSDFSAIIYNIKKIEDLIKNENLGLDIFLSKINVDINSISIDIVGLFEDIYESFITYYKKSNIEKELNRLIEEYVDIINCDSTKIKIYKSYTMSNNDFFNFLFNNVKNGMLWDKWEEKLKYYSISEEREIFSEFINEFLNKITDYIVLEKENINIILSNFIDKKNFQEKINVFKKILEHYKNISDVEIFSDIWMKKILKTLGHPDKNPINWIGISQEEIETMKRWLVKNQLEEIFTIEVGDKRRLEFWKKYISYIKKVEFYKDLNQAIVMETDNHTFIEFGERGNAFYAYEINYLNIEKISNLKKSFYKTECISKLKNPYDSIINLSHYGSWEGRLMSMLQYRGYEIKGKNYGYNR